jgi:hypothetical protein
MCALVSIMVATLVHAQERQSLTPAQTEIMRLVGQVDGFITPELHDKFWADFPAEVSQNARLQTRLAIDFAYLPQVYGAFERQLWNSAKLSLDKGALLSTPEYAKAKERLIRFTDVASFDAPSFVAAATQADNILRAAASGAPYETPQGSMRIDAAYIESVLAGMDAAQSRLARLLDPEFPIQPKEWKYPDGHFRVFWPDPLVESRVAIPEGGYGREVVVYANRYDRDVYLSVQFLSFFKAEAEPVRALLYGKLIASQMGFSEAEATLGDWEDHSSALVEAKATIEGKAAELSLRLILAPEHEGAWVLVCLSEGRPGFASALRASLDAAVRPD